MKACRRWSKKEIGCLYDWSRTKTQEAAAQLLGRSVPSVVGKVRALGIRWGQGYTTASQIADEFGVSRSVVGDVIKTILWSELRHCTCYDRNGEPRSYRLSQSQADRVRRVVQGRIKRNAAHAISGKISAYKRAGLPVPPDLQPEPRRRTFSVGETVTWDFRGEARSGVIVAVVPPDTPPWDSLPEDIRSTRGIYRRSRSAYSKTTRRKHESYLVLCPRGVKRAKVYWPIVANLRRVHCPSKPKTAPAVLSPRRPERLATSTSTSGPVSAPSSAR